MKNSKIISLYLVLVTLFFSCTKKETIKEEYNPPQPKLYGTWHSIDVNPSTSIYLVFSNDGSNFAYSLSQDANGFRTKDAFAYSATDKQLGFGSYFYNYTVIGDTMRLYSTPTNVNRFARVSNPSFTPSNWCSVVSVVKKIKVPRGMVNNNYPFGIEGDFLFSYGNDNINQNIYKFNSLTEQYVDSTAVSAPATTCVKPGAMYAGFDYGNYNLYKFPGSTTISTNTIQSVTAISINVSSGVIYAYSNSGQMFTGIENSSFSELFNFSMYNCNNVLYYKNDEFLCLKDGMIHRIKISPSFTVVASYEQIPNFYIYTLSTNGQDVWVYGYDNTASAYKLLKVAI